MRAGAGYPPGNGGYALRASLSAPSRADTRRILFFVVTLTQNVDISSIKFTSTRYEGELLVHQIPPIMLANSIEFWRVHKNSANFFR